MEITVEYVNSVDQLITPGNAEIRIDCPYCHDDKKKMYVNLEKRVYICFKCTRHGKITEQYAPNLEDWHKLYEFSSKPIKEVVKTLPHSVTINKMDISSNFIQHEAREYLKQRGITDHEILGYDIRVSLEGGGRYRNTIIFPISVSSYRQTSPSQGLDYFVCRRYTNEEPKYINAPWPKKDSLFITSWVKSFPPETIIRPMQSIVIVEGVFDALACTRATTWTSIALLGKTATSQQLSRLMSYARPQRYLIYLDADALTQAINLKLQLDTLGLKAVIVTSDMDAADLFLKDKSSLERILLDGDNQLKKR